MVEADAFTVTIGIVVSVFAVLSFLNTLGMHLALRHIRKHVDGVVARIHRILDDPVAALVPVVVKSIQRLNDDKEFRGHVGGLLVYVGRSLYAAVTGGPSPDGNPSTPKPKGGWLGKLGGLVDLGRSLGFIRDGSSSNATTPGVTLPTVIDPNRPGWLK